MRFPVSFAQQRLWFLDRLMPGPAYNMPYAYWLDGPLDAGALQRAMDTVVARHAVLRTSLVAFDGVPEQVVADAGTVPIERVELPAGLDDDERTRQAEAIADDMARGTFDLAAGPLLRAALVAAGPDRHLFVLVLQHSISDGESMKVMIGELSACYVAETTGVPAQLPTLWLEYGDYAVWQQDRIRGEALERQLGYWREHLRGAPQLLELPTDRPRPTRQTSSGEVATISIDPAVGKKLAEVAHGANATMFMVVLAGTAAVLSRYARQTDMLIGTQVAGRTHPELLPMLGILTNTLALRIRLDGDPAFDELLGRVRDTTLDALAHEQLPFEKLVEDFAPDRTLAHAPLSQVACVSGPLTPTALNLPGITARGRLLRTHTSKIDTIIYMDTDDPSAIEVAIEYNSTLWDQPWADRFLGCIATLLEHAADAPATPLSDLPLLADAELQALTTGQAQPAPPSDGDTDIRSQLRASASMVTDSEKSLPLGDVLDRAARLARVLADRGVGPEVTVGLCTGRGIDMLTALLGVWWAGGAYVPLDPGYPQARLALMASGARPRLVICDADRQELATAVAAGAEVIRVDDPAIAAAAPLAAVPVPPNALAYVLFTSGSTGRPKGVAVEHRGFASLIASFRRALPIGPGDRTVAAAAMSFDISLFEIMLTLACGADLVIATADEAREPDRLRGLIERTAATVMQATPQTWRLLASAGGVPASLRLRLSGAEKLPPDVAEQLLAPGAEVWNLYGPTETAVWASAGVVTSTDRSAELGPPIDNLRMYVLDEHLVPVPVGVVGEVCIGGRGVTRGYYDQPRLTARAFRPDPWSAEPGGRLYRTGDLGRWREDGSLELIGRNDHQVKVRGFRIELGEIEAALRSHRDVRQAVTATAPRAGEHALVGYIVPRRGSAVAKPGADILGELRPHLRAVLPEYMVPSLVVALPALPLTPTAKVDRAALPAPEWDDVSPAALRTEPRNPVEATLAQILGDLLATKEPVGVHDNLFAIGGHSLTATRLVARVADTYGVTLPVHKVFAGPTVAELAEVVSADPDFGIAESSPAHAELAELSDEDLDDLLRAAIAQRNQRRAATSDPDIPGTDTATALGNSLSKRSRRVVFHSSYSPFLRILYRFAELRRRRFRGGRKCAQSSGAGGPAADPCAVRLHFCTLA
jgi:amino acid adenylation domain-containing protein